VTDRDRGLGIACLQAIATRAKRRRVELGLEPGEVARRLGISRGRFYNIECYGAGMIATVERWAHALGMDPRELAFGPTSPSVAELVELLREVQLEHSRALIALSPGLEAGIILAIGRHPRDGDG
jgi:transcriptional regulator with XRE-family HTH domain